MIGFKRSIKFKIFLECLRVFYQYEIYSCFIELTQPFTIAVSNESGLKSGRLKYSDISIK